MNCTDVCTELFRHTWNQKKKSKSITRVKDEPEFC